MYIFSRSAFEEDVKSLIKGICKSVFEKRALEYEKLGNMYSSGKAGGTPSTTIQEYYNGEIPFLSITDMTAQGKFINKTAKNISALGLMNSSAWVVPKNSLILSMYASVGLVAINNIEIATSQAMFSMTFDEHRTVEFVYYYLTYFKHTQIHQYLETGTQSNINADIIKSITIPNFGATINDNIAAALNTLDNILVNAKDTLTAYQKQKAYLLREMFI